MNFQDFEQETQKHLLTKEYDTGDLIPHSIDNSNQNEKQSIKSQIEEQSIPFKFEVFELQNKLDEMDEDQLNQIFIDIQKANNDSKSLLRITQKIFENNKKINQQQIYEIHNSLPLKQDYNELKEGNLSDLTIKKGQEIQQPQILILRQVYDIIVQFINKYNQEIVDVQGYKQEQQKLLNKDISQINNSITNNNKYEIILNNVKNDLHHVEKNQFERISKILKSKNYLIQSYLAKGGEADILNGIYINPNGKHIECVFRMYSNLISNEQNEEELNIVSGIKDPQNLLQYFDHFSFQQNGYIHSIFIVEKCQFTLLEEINLKIKNKQFSFDGLSQIIIDLLDGLIELRMNQLVHQDIKPMNILKNSDDYYIYSDFGATTKAVDGIAQFSGSFTKKYCSPEQQQKKNYLDYSSDIYSLGKTFQVLINNYVEQQNLVESPSIKGLLPQSEIVESKENDKTMSEIENKIGMQSQSLQNQQRLSLKNEQMMLQEIKSVIEQDMVQEEQSQRKEVIFLIEKFYNILGNQNKILKEHCLKKWKKVIDMFTFDNSKEISYVQRSKMIYCELYLKTFLDYYNINISLTQLCNNIPPDQINKLNLEDPLQQEFINVLLKVSKQYFEQGELDKSLNLVTFIISYIDKFKLELIEEKINALNQQGRCYFSLGEYKNQQIAYESSLKFSRDLIETNPELVISALGELGNCYMISGDNSKALMQYNEALEIINKKQLESIPQFAGTLFYKGQYYKQIGDIPKALEYLYKSLNIFKEGYDENHPSIAYVLSSIAQCYFAQNQIQKSLDYNLSSLETIQKIYDGKNLVISQTLQQIGDCYLQLGKSEDSLKYQLQSLEMFKHLFAENHPSIIYSLNKVGDTYKQMNQIQQALLYYTQALQMARSSKENNNNILSLCLMKLGNCYLSIKELQNSFNLLNESMTLREQIYSGGANIELAESFQSMGNYFQTVGQAQKAIQFYEKSLFMLRELFKEGHYETASVLNQLGVCYMTFQQPQKALSYLLEALQMSKCLFKNAHSQLVAIQKNIGLCYLSLKDFQMAKSYLENSQIIAEQLYTKNSIDYAYITRYLANLYENIGQVPKSLQMQQDILLIFQSKFDIDHPEIALQHSYVGGCQLKIKDYDNALQNFLSALKIVKSTQAGNHPSVATYLNNIGNCYLAQQNYNLAVQYFIEGLEMIKELHKGSPLHPQVATSLKNVGCAYYAQRQYKLALQYFQESYEIQKQLFQPNHPQIQQTLNYINSSQKNLIQTQF